MDSKEMEKEFWMDVQIECMLSENVLINEQTKNKKE